MKLTAPKGTRDILPSEVFLWQKAEKCFQDVCHLYGYEEIRIPTFEDTLLYNRGVGDTTDVVTKEMYTFDDKGGRSLTLRPEGTAGVVRSFVENGMNSAPLPVRLFYNISCFRYEKMQKGRYREFHQFGLESFGAKGPTIDAEIISIVSLFFKKMGLNNIRLCINSIGCPDCRTKYNQLLKDYFTPHISSMCDDCKTRFERNPLRIIDCKIDGKKDIVINAPRLIDHLCNECSDHFNTLKSLLDNMDISYEVDPNIVRGLDYYTRTVFEFVSCNVGTQGTICGGGRYDGLVETCGGPSVPGIGFAMGVERLLLEAEAQGAIMPKPDYVKLYIATMTSDAKDKAPSICLKLREAGIGAEMDLLDRSFKAQMKYAGKSGIPYMMVLGDDELSSGIVKIKRMSDGLEEEIELSNLISYMSERR